MIPFPALSTVKKGPAGPPGAPSQEVKGAVASKVGSEILKARNAAGKQARSSPKAEYQRPHRTHVSAERRIANAKHHAAELEDEARKNAGLYESILGITIPEEEEENRRIQGLNFDDDRKKRGRQQRDRDDEDRRDDDDAAALAEAATQKGFANAEGAGRYFQDAPPDRLGDLDLVEPEEMKRLLGPTVRFAKHAMLLAEERLRTGTPRDEVVRFLGSLYVGLEDRAYANKALREFGAGTGIIDVYPLEVMEHLLENVPSFFNRVSKGRFFTSSRSGRYRGVTGAPIVLTYDPALRVRGFALQGGPKPGYLFEPVDPPGTYHLTFATAGTFQVLVSAISKAGALMIEELVVEVAAGEHALSEAETIKRQRAHDEEAEADGAEEGRRDSTPPGAGSATPASAEAPARPEGKSKRDDLTIHFPRRA